MLEPEVRLGREVEVVESAVVPEAVERLAARLAATAHPAVAVDWVEAGGAVSGPAVARGVDERVAEAGHRERPEDLDVVGACAVEPGAEARRGLREAVTVPRRQSLEHRATVRAKPRADEAKGDAAAPWAHAGIARVELTVFGKAPVGPVVSPIRLDRGDPEQPWASLTGVIRANIMTHVKKTQVYLPDEELEALHGIAQRTGQSVASLIREAIRSRWMEPASEGPIALFHGEPRRASVDHDSIYDKGSDDE